MGDKQTEKSRRILVHICCAACFSYVYQILKKENFKITGFFYNPQVHGRAEFLRRKEDVEKFCQENNIPLIAPKYDIQEFFQPIMPYQDKNSIKFINDKKRWKIKRCQLCNSIIMSRLYDLAKEKKMDYFTSTMLVSPYKDHDEVWNLSLSLEKTGGPQFYYKDFRKGYWSGRNFAKNHSMHIPNYCGCVYSSEEGILE